MFGIGGGEMIFIIFIALMLFGTDKIPEFARTFGKAMAQLRNATNDIKSEIHRSAEANGLDRRSLTGGLESEIEDIKRDFSAGSITRDFAALDKDIRSVADPLKDPLQLEEISSAIHSDIDEAKIDLEDITSGPIKRMR